MTISRNRNISPEKSETWELRSMTLSNLTNAYTPILYSTWTIAKIRGFWSDEEFRSIDLKFVRKLGSMLVWIIISLNSMIEPPLFIFKNQYPIYSIRGVLDNAPRMTYRSESPDWLHSTNTWSAFWGSALSNRYSIKVCMGDRLIGDCSS